MSVKILEKLFCELSDSNNFMKGGNISKENSSLLKIIIAIIILFAVYSYFDYKNKSIQPTSNQPNSNNLDSNNSNNSNESKLENNIMINKGDINKGDINKGDTKEILIPVDRLQQQINGDIYPVLRNYDYRTYNDDLTPPRKRDDYNIPANVFYPDRYGLYTRGGPNPFKKMGYLNNKTAEPGDPYKFLTLMGRQKYYNSNTYEYYVVSTNKDENIKFDIDKKREIFTGDSVTIPQLNNLVYEANIDKILEYEYDPYIL
jgi:hypothetical protein